MHPIDNESYPMSTTIVAGRDENRGDTTPLMQTGERIRQAREAKGWSQADLAQAVGISQAAIQKIESGETLRTRFIQDIERALDIANEAATGAVIPARQLVGERDLPIFGATEGGPGQLILDASPIDYMKRPAALEGIKDAYGIYVTGDSMVPEFEPADTALVNPRLPPIPGTTCIFYKRPPFSGEALAMIKRLVRSSSDRWRVRQWNPPDGADAEFDLSKREWSICHRTVGKYSRR
jgi:transcriptional regulator with XRE-family HTH domain